MIDPLDSGQDPVERSLALDLDIIAIPRDRVFTKRTVVMGFVIVTAMLGFAIGLLINYTSDTNEAVRQEIPGLKRQIDDRTEALDDAQSVLDQELAYILQLRDLLRANGIQPPEVTITPED